MNFSIRLKALRENKGLSQAQLAHELNVGVGSVGMWESTQRTPPAKKLQTIANYFDVSVDYLLGREEKSLIERPPYEVTDKPLIDLMKLFEIMTEIQKAQVLGFAIGLLEQSGINVKSVLGY